ncbi:MAG TPA: sigma-70 family RNA polymerase sigma factor [Candidatus Acidoferrales bacterium]
MAPELIRRRAPGSEEAAAVSDVARVLTWPEDEAGLMTELRSGSQPAFDWLVTHYHRPVFGLVAGILYDPSEAADVTQEVFLRAFRGIGGFRQGSSLKTWLYRIAVRQALNHRRWSWRHLRQQSSMDAETGKNGLCAEFKAPGASPFDELASREVQQAVRQALGRVAENFRTAVILRDLEGLAYEEIAEVLDVSVGTVKSRILRGRRALRELLEPVFASVRAVP